MSRHTRPSGISAPALLLVASLLFPATTLLAPAPLAAQDADGRPMTFLDMQHLRSVGDPAVSPDGDWLLYTLRTPDWQEDRNQTDIHMVSMSQGVSSSRRLTFTETDNETDPSWAPDGSFFVFVSDRDRESDGEADDQLYMMAASGSEARKVTALPNDVTGFQFSPDGAWLVLRSGARGMAQLHGIRVAELSAALTTGGVPADEAPVTLTDEPAGIGQWDFSPDGGTIYFVRPDEADEEERARRRAGFTVDIRNRETPYENLYALELAAAVEGAGQGVTALTDDEALEVSVEGFTVSPDGAWIAFQGGSLERYERNITGSRLYADLFLMEVATGEIERLTDNYEVGEGGVSFSPDSRWMAFSAPEDMTRYTMTENKIYLREVADRGGDFRMLGGDFDNSLSPGWWSEDGRYIYFNAGVTVTRQLHAVDTRTGRVEQLTDHRASPAFLRDEDTGALMVSWQDPTAPTDWYVMRSVDDANRRERWTRLTDANPQVRELALGQEEEVWWTSTDGKRVGGVLVYPVGYREGQRYPLIVAIHGGPASADVLRFNGGYGAQVYAGAGYAVLKPNYRGSTNYGNAHRTDIVGDYFTLGYDDIMTGVDHLIAEGIVDGDQMGVLGWSAGGHWSNWILTQTDRFKAISSGAGTMNWISMYAQSDVQRNRQFYVGDGFLYEDFDTYFDQSPLKYIANASTPTMIHVVEGDPRVPSPQSVELHMALKKLDVPTELFMYPGQSHGIPDARNRLVKSVSEMAWMDYWVRGIGEGFDWEMVMRTLEEAEAERPIT
jgi:dipeptidyl aminopeptidase/acylaminoacyl peptidase